MMRSGPIPRKTRMPSRGKGGLRSYKPIATRNPKRRAKEFARAYGSEARVLWMQDQPCVGCGRRPSENAHTVGGGASRKADASTIAPLCASCHRAYDQHRAPFDDPERREVVKLHAAFLAARWDYLGKVKP